jgi:hypothetical protein
MSAQGIRTDLPTFIDSFVDMAGLVIEYGKWGWFFEWSEIFGPSVVHAKTGNPLDNQPPESSPFWRVVSLWARQGKRTEARSGTIRLAVWDEPPPITYYVKGRLIVRTDMPEGCDPDLSKEIYLNATSGKPDVAFKSRAGQRGEQ